MTIAVHSANQLDSQRKSLTKSSISLYLAISQVQMDCLPLSDLLGQSITEEYRPSLQRKPNQRIRACF